MLDISHICSTTAGMGVYAAGQAGVRLPTLPEWEYMSMNASSSSLIAASLLGWLAVGARLLRECSGCEGLILRRLFAAGGSCPLQESPCITACFGSQRSDRCQVSSDAINSLEHLELLGTHRKPCMYSYTSKLRGSWHCNHHNSHWITKEGKLFAVGGSCPLQESPCMTACMSYTAAT